MAGSRVLKLRRDDTCQLCGTPLPSGTRAHWDADARKVTCLTCHGNAAPVTTESSLDPTSADPTGATAGTSARREYERRCDQREQQVRSRHPHIGGLLLDLVDEPQHQQAWAKGARGERHLGARLDALEPEGVFTLHDRAQPGSRANFDHIVINSSGVTIVDAKFYKGVVECKDIGPLMRSEPRLFVAGRDRTQLVTSAVSQVNKLTRVVERAGFDVPVTGALCFVEAEWRLFAKPFQIDGIGISGPKSLSRSLLEDGPVTPQVVQELTRFLDEQLPPPEPVSRSLRRSGQPPQVAHFFGVLW